MTTIKNLNLLTIFCKVSELGSFTKASAALSAPKSRVSRSIGLLEQELGVKLFNRTTRSTVLTPEGEKLFETISPLLLKVDNSLEETSSSSDEMSGAIKITAPEDMAQTILAEMISKYVSKYPNMEVECVITNDFLDLGKEKIDLALRVGRLKDSTLIQSRLAQVGLILVGSKKYFKKYGTPLELVDLKDHRFLSFRKFDSSLFNLKKEDLIKTVTTSDSFSMLLNLALSGDGLCILPDYYCKKYLENESLIRVLPSWEGRKSNINLVYSPTKKLPKKVREFINIAKEVSI